MWVAKFKVWHANSYTMEKTVRLDASYVSHTLNSFETGGATWLARVMLVFGPQSGELISECVKDPRLVIEQVTGRQVFFSHPAKSAFHDNLLDRRVFFVKPILATKGREYWTVASFRKKSIEGLFKRLNRDTKVSKAEMLSLKQEPVDVFMPGVLCTLSEKQKWAYEMACKYSYYSYPRGKDAQQIAKILTVPESTFREHLRKAESKLFPALYQWAGDTYQTA